MKQYRKRFVLISMSLVTFVLLAVFVVLAVTTHYENYDDLRETMQHVLQPINSQLYLPKDGVPPEIPPEAPPLPDDLPQDEAPGRRSARSENSQIVTALVRTDEGVVSILSTEDSDISEDDVRAVLSAVIEAESDFGKVPASKMIYYRETVGTTVKIALTQTSYITYRTWKSIGQYFLILLMSFGIFLFITVRLSKFAVRPMERAMQLERQFVADVSHDLKTPITVILANNSILKSNADATVETQMQWVDSTETAAKNMMHLINDMLTLSSLDGREQAARLQGSEMSAVSLSAAAEKAELQLESVAFDRKIMLNADIQDDLFIRAAAGDPERICSGLLENALKYEPTGGEVTMTLKANKKKAVLSIRNRNSYISPEEQPHIFERFYRGDKARDAKQGHGLGLPIIKQLADLLGAEITVSSTETDGTAFRVEFDLTSPPAESH